MSLKKFRKRYFEILGCEEPIRTNRLTNLMSDMEKVYDIPILSNVEFNRQNPKAMHLYRLVSNSRNFEEVR